MGQNLPKQVDCIIAVKCCNWHGNVSSDDNENTKKNISESACDKKNDYDNGNRRKKITSK